MVIGYATSSDGRRWRRMSERPVLVAQKPWEKDCVMCPHLLWDEQDEPLPDVVLGRRTQRAERHRLCHQPRRSPLEQAQGQSHLRRGSPPRLGEAQSDRLPGAAAAATGTICFTSASATSPTLRSASPARGTALPTGSGHPANPIIRPGKTEWDHDACYKPYAIFDGEKWLLWYNGRHGGLEQIGLVTHEGEISGSPRTRKPDSASQGQKGGPLASICKLWWDRQTKEITKTRKNETAKRTTLVTIGRICLPFLSRFRAFVLSRFRDIPNTSAKTEKKGDS